MKIILLTSSDLFPIAFEKILNPGNIYCSIVVDDVGKAEKYLEKFNPPKNLIQPLYELKEIVSKVDYDLLLCFSNPTNVNLFPNFTKYCGVPKNKFVQFYLTMDGNNHLIIKRALKYFEKNSAEFKMFATGMSYTSFGLDTNQFKYKLFNFAKASQDLYFDYQIAKFAVSRGGGLKFALIGLAPYSFHHDQSKGRAEAWRMTYYLLALDDVHNFWLKSEDYKKLFSEDFLKRDVNIENFDLNNPVLDKLPMHTMNFYSRFSALERTESWHKKIFPETVEENKKIFDDYLTLCEEKNIRPIVFLPPVSECYKKYFHREKLADFYKIIQAANKKHSTMFFVDGWNVNGVSDIDFGDVDHMNLLGAAKFSKLLNSVIEKLEQR